MKVAIGSQNPAKINAVERGFLTVWPGEKYEFVGVRVSSGVADQPMSDEEGITGARKRAQAALLATPDAEYGVGLEGNQKKVGDTWFAVAWIVVINSKGNEGIGGTPAVISPPKIIDEILKGKELGVVIDEQFGTENSKQKEGYMGLMTNNILTRSESYKQAVVMALARFIRPEVF